MTVPRGLKTVRLFSVALIATMLAACARSSVIPHKYGSLAVHRQALLKPSEPFKSKYGLASFYSEGSATASGEKFDHANGPARTAHCHSARGCALPIFIMGARSRFVLTTAVRLFAEEMSTYPIPRHRRWELLNRALPRSNWKSFGSRSVPDCAISSCCTTEILPPLVRAAPAVVRRLLEGSN